MKRYGCAAAGWSRRVRQVLLLINIWVSVRTRLNAAPRSEWPVLKTLQGTELRINENRIGSMEMEIAYLRLADRDGNMLTEVNSGDPLRIEIGFDSPQPITEPVFGLVIYSRR